MKTFEGWMDRVDAGLDKRFGMVTADLPDQPYYDWWMDGVTPREAVHMIVDSELADMSDGMIRYLLDES